VNGTYELTQRFFFDAAHTLRREVEREGSRRLHGHTYHAEVTVTGTPDPESGMVVDLGIVRERIAAVRERLDHRLLDEVPGLGKPTLENLCAFIARHINGLPWPISSVRVWRDGAGDGCLLRAPAGVGASPKEGQK
jgi:6-pyruvoyltetrahydropterin/6-carboxytetrahydropterin synthase